MGIETAIAIAAVAAVAGAGVAVGSAIASKKKKPSPFTFPTAQTPPKVSKLREPSRLSLISTSPQGVLNEAQTGRRKLLNN